jgi:hypothetical protein
MYSNFIKLPKDKIISIGGKFAQSGHPVENPVKTVVSSTTQLCKTFFFLEKARQTGSFF